MANLPLLPPPLSPYYIYFVKVFERIKDIRNYSSQLKEVHLPPLMNKPHIITVIMTRIEVCLLILYLKSIFLGCSSSYSDLVAKRQGDQA